MIIIFRIITVMMLCLLIHSFAYSDDNQSRLPDYGGELNMLDEFEDRENLESHLPTVSFMDKYFSFKRNLLEKYGLDYIVEFAPIMQYSQGEFHADSELNVIGFWNFLESDRFGKGNILVWYQNSLTWGSLTTSEFMSRIGVLSPLNGGDTFPEDSANRLQLLVWEQYLANDILRLMVGKITSRVTVNLNRYAVSDREDFFSPMIVNNPVVPFTVRIGLGAFGQFIQKNWYISAMVRDADAMDDFIDFDSLDTGNWEYTGEFAITPDIPSLGQGHYRFTLDYTDSIGSGDTFQPSSWSISLSFDQDIKNRVGAFFRYAYADTPLRAFQQRIAMGFQVLGVPGYDGDRIGVAGWWGDPTNEELNDEYAIEFFYKALVARIIEVSPDLQLIFDPALSDKGFIGVVGFRVRIVL